MNLYQHIYRHNIMHLTRIFAAGALAVLSAASVAAMPRVPFAESWRGVTPSNAGWTLPAGVWKAVAAAPGLVPADGDGGLLLFGSPAEGAEGTALSPRIALAGAVEPRLAFSLAAQGDVAVSVTLTGASGLRRTEPVEAAAAGEWIPVDIPLHDFAGEEWVSVGFTAASAGEALVKIDDVSLNAPVKRDMALLGAEWPERLAYGATAEVRVRVVNNGSVPSRAYIIEITDSDGAVVASTGEQPWLAPGAGAVRQVAVDPEAGWPGSVELTARIVSPDDELPLNDVSEPVTLAVDRRELPVVTDLDGMSCGYHAVELVWSSPDIPEPEPVEVTDDMEHYDDFASASTLASRGWTLHDGGGGPTGVPVDPVTGREAEFPGAGEPHAFMVLNPALAGLSLYDADGTPTGWMPHSGDRCLAAMRHTTGRNDGWLISPELTGLAQTVRFWIKGALEEFPETYEFLYSATGNALTDFVRVATRMAPVRWTEASFNLPRGAKYFAIRCTSSDAMALLVDDITCVTAASMPQDLLLTGYNVWRDGEQVNDVPVTAHSWLDYDVAEGAHLYHVSALYSLGESALSNGVTLMSHITGVEADGPEITVQPVAGGVWVRGAASARVYNTAGAHVDQGAATTGGEIYIPLGPGLYIVRAGTRTAKVAIR